MKDSSIKPSSDGVLVYLNVDKRLDKALNIAKSEKCFIIEERTSIDPWWYRVIFIAPEGNRIALHLK